MSLLEIIVVTIGCLVLQQSPGLCMGQHLTPTGSVLGASTKPEFTGSSVDVVLTAQAAIAWDVKTSTVLYEKNATEQRPIASLSKLLSALTVRKLAPVDRVIEIPPQARRAQRMGAHIMLPVGEHASVKDLLAASLIASANDAIVSLAVAISGSETAFADAANAYAQELGVEHTLLSNATGLSGGDQHSTAQDVMTLLKLVYKDPVIRPMLIQKGGALVTQEGSRRPYKTTNQLIGTYLPILAAKTGYTRAAGESVAIITEREGEQAIGIVILGSSQRFQDAKVLAEWIWRNYTWPKQSQN